MSEILNITISKVQQSKAALCKFITANDTGTTGGHQCGYHVSKDAWSMFLDKEATKGSNIDIPIRIHWQNDFETESRFKYYGVGTRNEYRITRFGRGFPFLNDENVGDLLVLARFDIDYYEAFVLQTDDDIDDFFSYFNLSYDKTNQIPITISVKTSVRERYKQADLEAYAFRNVHRAALNYLVLLNKRECANVQKKIKNGSVLGLKQAIRADSGDFDVLLEELKQRNLGTSPKISLFEGQRVK